MTIVILCTLMAYCLAQTAVFGWNHVATLAEAIQVLHALPVSLFAAVERTLGPSGPP